MKKKYILYGMMVLWGLSSCVEDEGNYDLLPINEAVVSGVEDEYNKLSYVETLSISPVIEGSVGKLDESQLEYNWFICMGSMSATDHVHIPICSEKNLEYPLDIAPGTYYVYLQIKDKKTNLKWEKRVTLNTLSQFVRGFYLFGDKSDGTCGMDFVSMITDRDTVVVKDIFTNSVKMKGAKDLIFTGDTWNDKSTSLWAVAESGSYSLEYSSSLSSFDIREDISPDKFIFPTIEVERPLVVVNTYPHAYGSGNYSITSSRKMLLTEHDVYGTSIYNDPEAYGNPVNRYSASSSDLYKVSPYVFYPGNTTNISRVTVYDKTNECFTGFNSSYYSSSYSRLYANDTETPFYFDQTKYTPVRTLVYGENGYGNSGRSYALMTDANGAYYIYGFLASTTPSKQFAYNIDLSIATDFEKASHYAFFSEQSVVLYSVGSQLYGYDYVRKEKADLKDFGSEITYLAMDFNSNDTSTDFIVATYNTSEKGIVRKFTIADDPNKIEITPHEKEVWNTDLRVVKVEYRNSAL